LVETVINEATCNLLFGWSNSKSSNVASCSSIEQAHVDEKALHPAHKFNNVSWGRVVDVAFNCIAKKSINKLESRTRGEISYPKNCLIEISKENKSKRLTVMRVRSLNTRPEVLTLLKWKCLPTLLIISENILARSKKSVVMIWNELADSK
jgi:hypothetical protein